MQVQIEIVKGLNGTGLYINGHLVAGKRSRIRGGTVHQWYVAADAIGTAAGLLPVKNPRHIVPPFPDNLEGISFFAKDSKGRWYYVNHARLWCSCPPPIDAP